MNKFETKKELREELEAFLDKNPHLRKFQKELDNKRKSAGNSENRLIIMNQLMTDKFHELNEVLRNFTSSMKKINWSGKQ